MFILYIVKLREFDEYFAKVQSNFCRNLRYPINVNEIRILYMSSTKHLKYLYV